MIRTTRIIVQLLLTKNQDKIISLAARLGGQTKAEAIVYNIWSQKQQNARFSLYFEISGLYQQLSFYLKVVKNLSFVGSSRRRKYVAELGIL